ncbi:MAG: glycosyltransferase family 9 protein [Arcobacteraceae bacterium]
MTNLLITRHDKIGDFITTLPMIKIAKRDLKDTNIIVMVSKVNYEFAKSIDYIDDVILYEDCIFKLIKAVKEKNIDVSISAFSDMKLAIALLLSGVKERFAPATKIAQMFYNHKIVQRRSKVAMTEYEYNIELLKAYDKHIHQHFHKPVIEFKHEEILGQLEKFKNEFNITEDYKYVAFHPGYGGSSDGNISLDDYISLAKSLCGKKHLKIVFTFGPDDKKSKEYITSQIDFDCIIYDSKLPLIDFCKLLCNFELLISTSTGPMHLAGAINIKTLSFFGSKLFASPRRWATVSDTENQSNFCIPHNYDRNLYKSIENKLHEIIYE